MANAAPPGPPRPAVPGALLLAFRRDPLGLLSELAAHYGDIVQLQVGPQRMVLLNNPDYIKDVLVTHNRSFEKGRALKRAKRFLGEGLLTSEGDFHRRQRRLAQPAFHRQRISSYGTTMVAYAQRTAERWRPGAIVDMDAEMMRLTLAIVGKTLFDTDVEGAAADVGQALTTLINLFDVVALPFAEQIERLPLPARRRFAQASGQLDAIVYRMISERRRSSEDRGDLLSMLLLAEDTEGDHSGMTDLQVRDEAMTIFLAGHETTANALTWTWYLLSQYPAVAAQLHAELVETLGGRPPTAEDLPRLRYTEMVFAEAIRLFPPAWIIARLAVEPVTIGGYPVPAGTACLMSQWVTHHDERYFPDPYRFDPQRWTPEARATRPRYVYYPFGGGPRQCIGEQFAWMEGVLVLATLAQQWHPRLLPGHAVALEPRITLRPRYGMKMLLERWGNY